MTGSGAGSGEAPDQDASGCFGTAEQRRLQTVADAFALTMAARPGACAAGRFRATDDPDRFGWEQIADILAEDGAFGFRLLPERAVAAARARIEALGFRLDTWRSHVARAETVLERARAVLAAAPEGAAAFAPGPTEPVGEPMRAVQAFLAAQGIAPFSGAMLAGRVRPARLVTAGAAARAPTAAAFAYLPHAAESRWGDTAWLGLIAVAPEARGQGLGRRIAARAAVEAVEGLGARRLYALIADGNLPSERMVAGLGFIAESGYVSGVAVGGGGGRFTR